MDPYQIVHERCLFVDHQTIKLQEPPDMVPVGELPRHMLLSADRYDIGISSSYYHIDINTGT
jgi:DNA replication licensing factor MCM5